MATDVTVKDTGIFNAGTGTIVFNSSDTFKLENLTKQMSMNRFNKIPIEIKRKDDSIELPVYQTTGSAGFDFQASEDVEVGPFQTGLVPTGLSVAIPEGFEIQIRPRSGISSKTGLRIANSPGTIDPDFRGEIKIIVQNTGTITHKIKKGERIAQGVVSPIFIADWQEVKELTITERGDSGFGSTDPTVGSFNL
jgi:dUTP pyrophosphatase